MSTPNDFFTTQSLLTFGGAVAATFIVPNAMQKAFNWNPRWLGLVIALAICFGVVITQRASGVPTQPFAYVVAFINGCLVFCSAAGATAVGATATTPAPLAQKSLPGKNILIESAAGPDRRGFLSRWF